MNFVLHNLTLLSLHEPYEQEGSLIIDTIDEIGQLLKILKTINVLALIDFFRIFFFFFFFFFGGGG